MSSRPPSSRALLALFFLSGATSLTYEVVFSKLLTYVFGVTAYATSTVLASFMGGLALGSWLLGRLADRVRNPIRFYGVLELAIGAYGALVPFLFGRLDGLWVWLYRGHSWGMTSLTAARFAVSSLFILLPAFLMGGTLPMLTRAIATSRTEAGIRVSRLYAANTFGAAFGTLFSSYLLIAFLGIPGAVGLSSLTNAVIFAVAWVMGGAVRPEGALPATKVEPVPQPREGPAFAAALPVAFASGMITFAHEVTWTHLQAVVSGTSVYAFGIMLATILLGLAAGARLVARRLERGDDARTLLVVSQVGAGAVVLLAIPLWERVPWVFQAFSYLGPGFVLMELARFLVCAAVLLPPAVLLGMTFPLVVGLWTQRATGVGRGVGVVYFWNTVGAILGSVACGFFVLPAIGSRSTLVWTATLNLVVGVALVAFVTMRIRARLLALAMAAASFLLGAFFWREWDPRLLAGGQNVYCSGPRGFDRVLFWHEDVQGGLTTVVTAGETRLLLTNGKFQGDNGGEMGAQRRFVLYPALFVRRFGRALVIGCGTGTSCSTVGCLPFADIDLAEISPGILQAADRYFTDINQGILRDPRVHVHLADGRDFLRLTDGRYDLITMELTSIWFAGAGNLYNAEFYQAARAHLAPGGVFQQWIQLHHIDRNDLMLALNTFHSSFPHVSLWFGGGQGVLVGSNDPLEIDFARLRDFDSMESLKVARAQLPCQSVRALLGEMTLYEKSFDDAVYYTAGRPVGWRLTYMPPEVKLMYVSTDLYPFLEYATPKGNAFHTSYDSNVAFLRSFDAHCLPTIRGVPDDYEWDILRGLAAWGKGDPARGLLHLLHAQDARDTPEIRELIRQFREEIDKREL